MTWEQKLEVLNTIAADRCSLIMRRPGSWFLCMPGFAWHDLHSGKLDSPTPEAAVESVWTWATNKLAGL